ncbi:MAG: HAD family hydrolase [Gammaproteobacteria bacterium]|nr:HAD family hydrolase [Gammaproteobacteria bacterium]
MNPPTPKKRLLLVLDFDGFLINSYALLRDTMADFGLDVGDEERFKNRRKFLKYLGGGKELLHNLVGMSLPKTRKLRLRLTEIYAESGRIYPEFIPLLNELIANPTIHCGILTRNYTLNPGPVIRAVLRNSGVNDPDLDFVIPIPVGVKKTEVLTAMRASRYFESLLGADEVGDYRAATAAGYDCVIGSYGFDTRERLVTQGAVPADCIYDTPAALTVALKERLAIYLDNVERGTLGRRVMASTSGRLIGARYDAKSAVHAAHE